jgi:hypothetical protein
LCFVDCMAVNAPGSQVKSRFHCILHGSTSATMPIQFERIHILCIVCVWVGYELHIAVALQSIMCHRLCHAFGKPFYCFCHVCVFGHFGSNVSLLSIGAVGLAGPCRTTTIRKSAERCHRRAPIRRCPWRSGLAARPPSATRCFARRDRCRGLSGGG